MFRQLNHRHSQKNILEQGYLGQAEIKVCRCLHSPGSDQRQCLWHVSKLQYSTTQMVPEEVRTKREHNGMNNEWKDSFVGCFSDSEGCTKRLFVWKEPSSKLCCSLWHKSTFAFNNFYLYFLGTCRNLHWPHCCYLDDWGWPYMSPWALMGWQTLDYLLCTVIWEGDMSFNGDSFCWRGSLNKWGS